MRTMIPADYWLGRDTLTLEYPWIAPGAIACLDRVLAPSMSVLEFGSGGSTMFFARRCQSVLSFETSPQWKSAVRAHIVQTGVTNVTLHAVQTIEECAKHIGERTFDVVLVDSDVISRPALAMYAKPLVAPGGFMILDNYDRFGLERLDVSQFPGWCFGTWNDIMWSGRGTRIFCKAPSCEGMEPVCHSAWGIPRRRIMREVRRYAAWIAYGRFK